MLKSEKSTIRFQIQKTTFNLFQNEFAKLRAFRAYVPYVPTSLKLLRAFVPTCLKLLILI